MKPGFQNPKMAKPEAPQKWEILAGDLSYYMELIKWVWGPKSCHFFQCCGSEMICYIFFYLIFFFFFFFFFWSNFGLNFGSGFGSVSGIRSRIRIFYEKYIWNADHLNIAKKQQFFNLVHIFGSGLFMKISLNCRSSKHCKRIFFKICTFLQLRIC